MRLALLTLALVPLPALAQEPMSIESIAARYFGAQTYCETGKWGMRDDAASGFLQVAFARCAHRDGRFKYAEHVDRPRKEVHWSDSQKQYRYSEYADFYKEYPLDDRELFTLQRTRSEVFPVFLSALYPRDANRLGDGIGYLQSYKPSSVHSTALHSVFERFNDPHERSGERLWVLNADKSIVRYEAVRDGVVLRFVELTSQEINRPLSAADLSQHVPLSARFSLQNNAPVFMAGLFAAAVAAGALVWGWLFARAASVDDVLRKRRRLWRLQFWSFGGIALALAALALLAASGRDSGHPPAIVLVYVMAIWCAAGFALAACFTLTSYPVQWLFDRRSR